MAIINNYDLYITIYIGIFLNFQLSSVKPDIRCLSGSSVNHINLRSFDKCQGLSKLPHPFLDNSNESI